MTGSRTRPNSRSNLAARRQRDDQQFSNVALGSGAWGRATTIGICELQPREGRGCNSSNQQRLELWNDQRGGRRASASLKRRAHLTKVRALRRKLRFVIDVQVARELDDPCHQRHNGEQHCPISRAALTWQEVLTMGGHRLA